LACHGTQQAALRDRSKSRDRLLLAAGVLAGGAFDRFAIGFEPGYHYS